jgi:hypothetical protein
MDRAWALHVGRFENAPGKLHAAYMSSQAASTDALSRQIATLKTCQQGMLVTSEGLPTAAASATALASDVSAPACCSSCMGAGERTTSQSSRTASVRCKGVCAPSVICAREWVEFARVAVAKHLQETVNPFQDIRRYASDIANNGHHRRCGSHAPLLATTKPWTRLIARQLIFIRVFSGHALGHRANITASCSCMEDGWTEQDGRAWACVLRIRITITCGVTYYTCACAAFAAAAAAKQQQQQQQAAAAQFESRKNFSFFWIHDGIFLFAAGVFYDIQPPLASSSLRAQDSDAHLWMLLDGEGLNVDFAIIFLHSWTIAIHDHWGWQVMIAAIVVLHLSTSVTWLVDAAGIILLSELFQYANLVSVAVASIVCLIELQYHSFQQKYNNKFDNNHLLIHLTTISIRLCVKIYRVVVLLWSLFHFLEIHGLFILRLLVLMLFLFNSDQSTEPRLPCTFLMHRDN